MKKRTLPLNQVYRLLEPGPVVLLSTQGSDGPNVMTQSWHMMLDFTPPLVALVVSGQNHSFEALSATRECVINIPTKALAKAVVGCGNTSGERVDKFKRYGLTAVDGSEVRAPLIEECYANLECRVIDSRMAKKYDLFVVEVVRAWVDPAVKDPRTLHHRGSGIYMEAGRSMRLPSRAK